MGNIIKRRRVITSPGGTTGGGGGTGTVTSVGSGSGLTGGPITTSGSLSIDTSVVEVLANKSTDIITDSTSNVKYPSVKSVFDWTTARLLTVNNQRINTLFTDSLTSATPYTQVQTSGSQTFGVGGCTFTGGNNSFTTNLISYNYNTLGTNFENYSISGRFTSTANSTGSYGIAFGVAQPFSNPSFCVALNTNAAGSRGTLYLINQTTPTVLATSTNALTYTNGDVLEIELKYAFDNITAIIRNITVPTRTESSITVPNTVTLSFARTVTDRYSQPTIYSLGGTQVVTSFSLSTNEITDPDIILTGDSRVVGLTNVTVPKRRYASQFGASIANKVMVWAKGGNTVANLNSMFPEIASQIKGNKKTYIVLFIGVNDAITLNTLVTFQADMLSLLQKVEAANMIPILVKIAYVSSGYANAAAINALITAQNAWLDTLSYRKFDENTSTTSAGALNGAYTTDGVHLNDLGNAVDTEALKTQLSDIYMHAATFVNTGAQNYTSSPTRIQNTSIQNLFGSTTESALYLGAATPSATNYNIKSEGTNTIINAPVAGGDIKFRIADTTVTGNTDAFEIDGTTGNVGIPIVVANQRMFSVAQNTAGVSIGSKVGATSEGAIYFGSGITPSLTNWGVSGTNGTTLLNVVAGGYIGFYTANVQRALMTVSNWQFYNTVQTSGNPTQFFFQSSANTGQTAGAGFVLTSFDLSATIQHASNTAVSVDRGFRVLAPTIAFATAGGVVSDAVTFEIGGAPTVGTNAAITRRWAARLLGNTAIGGSIYIGDTTGTTAPTALLTLAAGTSTVPPTRFTDGTQLATPLSLVLEPETGGNNLLFTTQGAARYTLAKTLTATATLDFGSTAASSSTDLTITVTGAADGDSVVVTPPNGSVVANSIYTAWVSAANTVTVRFSNLDIVAAADPASGTFRAVVFKY
jgi:lysophospholipase L1-like esterase